VTLSVDVAATHLVLPRVDGPSPSTPPTLTPSDATPSEPTGVAWRVERDVLARETSCVVDHGSTYDEGDVTCTEHYVGRVTVNTETFAQRVEASSSFTLAWPDATVSSEVRMTMLVTERTFDVSLELDCRDGDTVMAQRRWHQEIPRDLG
jgi:hypothetical protein